MSAFDATAERDIPRTEPERARHHAADELALKRIVVGFGFWIFLLSDIVMFSALFAAILAVAVIPLVAYPYWRDVRAFASWWVGMSRAHAGAGVHPADRGGALLRRLHDQLEVQRFSGRARPHLRPTL